MAVQGKLEHEEIRRLLGDVEDERIAEILDLQPTVADIEAALIRLNGDNDVLGKSGHPLDALVASIIEILTADDVEEVP